MWKNITGGILIDGVNKKIVVGSGGIIQANGGTIIANDLKANDDQNYFANFSTNGLVFWYEQSREIGKITMKDNSHLGLAIVADGNEGSIVIKPSEQLMIFDIYPYSQPETKLDWKIDFGNATAINLKVKAVFG